MKEVNEDCDVSFLRFKIDFSKLMSCFYDMLYDHCKKSWPFCEMSVMRVQGKEDIKKLETVVNW